MARCAAAGTIIAGMIVRTHEIEERSMQAHFLQIEINGIGAIECAKSAFRKTARRMPGRLEGIWISEFILFFAAAFEDAQNISRLAEREAGQGIDEGKNPILLCHLGRDRNWAFETQRDAIDAIGLAEAIIF